MKLVLNRNHAMVAGAGAVMMIWLGAWLWTVSSKKAAAPPAETPTEKSVADASAKAGPAADAGSPAPAAPTAPVIPESLATPPEIPDVPDVPKADEKAGNGFPFVGRIKADDVYTRSGPGLNYYPTGKVHENDAVNVLAEKSGWLEIKPPAGQFSWIDKAYIQIDAKDPSKGAINGTNVRVRAGSLIVGAARDIVQMKISKGAVVEVIGESDGFSKVRPPAGASVWVSTDFVIRPGPTPRPADIADASKDGAAKALTLKASDPIDLPAPAMDVVYRNMTAELAKAAGEQNLDGVIDQFSKLRAFSNDESTKRYCDYYIGDLQRRKRVREARAESEKIGVAFADEVKKAREEVLKQTKVEPVARPAAAAVEAAKMDEFTGYIMTTRYWEAFRGSWEGGTRFRLTRGLPPEDAYVVWVQSDGVDLGKYMNRKVTLRGKLMLLEEHRSKLLLVKEVVEQGATAAAGKAPEKAAEPTPVPEAP